MSKNFLAGSEIGQIFPFMTNYPYKVMHEQIETRYILEITMDDEAHYPRYFLTMRGGIKKIKSYRICPYIPTYVEEIEKVVLISDRPNGKWQLVILE